VAELGLEPGPQLRSLQQAILADACCLARPATACCLVLATGRAGFTGLPARDGAERLGLRVLTPTETVTLLGRLAGGDRGWWAERIVPYRWRKSRRT